MLVNQLNDTSETSRDEFESPLPHDITNSNTVGYLFLNTYGGAMGAKFKGVKLYAPDGKKWYVEYLYRVPDSLRPMHGNAKWKRFKVYEDINRVKSLEYAERVLVKVQIALEGGYDPFMAKAARQQMIARGDVHRVTTCRQAIELFKTAWAKRGLAPASMIKYTRTADRFIDYLVKINLADKPPLRITGAIVEQYLEHVSPTWSNSGYNNELNFLSTILIYLVDKQLLPVNPAKGIVEKKVTKTKHKYYSERLFEKMQEVLKAKDPYLYFAAQCVYQLCLRSEMELKYMKVGNILVDRKQVFVTIGKTGQRYIPMSDEMCRIFKERGILDADPELYVFSAPPSGKHFVPDWVPGKKPFGKGFFSKRFSKLRKEIGLDSDYTIYSLKHTRIIHLKIDGVADADVMALTGHTDYAGYAAYLKDLGLTVNPDAVNSKTRKF